MLDIDVVDLDRDGPRRRSARLTEQLRDAIRSGRLRAGAAMPSTRRLAADLGVSRGVTVRAYEQLTAEGYLATSAGAGTTVAAIPQAGVRRQPPVPSPFSPTNPGQIDPLLFPRAELADAFAAALRDLPAPDLGYGDPRGLPHLREVLADWLGRTRGVAAHPDQLVVTTGFSQGLRLFAEHLADGRGGRVAVEDPGSIGIRRTLEAGGVTPVPTPVDEHGIEVARLGGRLAGAVVTPAHQFPTGVVLAPERRIALVDWAVRTGALVLEDDYDREYRFDASPVGSVHGLAPDHVVHGGSLSKLFSPALRIGWLVVPHDHVAALAERKYWSDIATSTVLQACLARLITDGTIDRITRRNRLVLGRRREALIDTVGTALPDWRIGGAAAGLHVTLTPPRPVLPPPGLALSLTAMRRFGGDQSDPTLVVGYGHVERGRIEQDVRRLAEAQQAG